jgi:hypothetical protein
LDQPESGIIGQALKRTSTAVLDFFILVLNIWKDFKVLSRFIQKCLYSSLLFGARVVCAQTEIFSTKPVSKIAGSQQLFFGLRLVRRIFEEILTSRNLNQNSATLWQIFSSNKSAPANRKKGFYTSRDPNKKEVGLIFVWSGSELWNLFKYSKLKLKNQK